MLRTAPNSHTVNMWHRRLAHLYHQDLKRLLESSDKHITDPMDVKRMTNPMDIEPVMDPIDVEPPIVDKLDKPRWETPRLHQEKKSASGCTGCVQTHQALGTLGTHPGRAHTAPNAKRTGNVNSDAVCQGAVHPDTARHGTVHSDAVCQGAVHPDVARRGI